MEKIKAFRHRLARLSGLLTLALLPLVGRAQVQDVYVLFKTHLDIGFTNLSSVVEKNYIDNFIPRAMDVAEQLRREGGEERYVWTTGSWLVQSFLDKADASQRERLCRAIEQGDIVWNAMPYTVESESMNREQFATLLGLSKELDKRFGRQTIGAKMTDVPGHTRGIVPLLAEAGVKFLHIGVNPASTVPDVPPLCRWQSPDGKEIILMYQKDYGSDTVLPDGKTAMVIAFTGDNHGPHSVEQVKGIYASLRKKYPGAAIHAATLNDVARLLEPVCDRLPILRQEIGDTWIYGYGSSPQRMACFRALGRLYAQWVKDGKVDPKSEMATRFMVRLGLIAEHTWGVDVKTHLTHWDAYDVDAFRQMRSDKAFKFSEESWTELTDNIWQAIELLPANLKQEAKDAIAEVWSPNPLAPIKNTRKAPLKQKNLTAEGAVMMQQKGMRMKAGVLAYQSFSMADYHRHFNHYMTHPYGWAYQDFGKPGLERSQAQSAEVDFEVVDGCVGSKGGELHLGLQDSRIDARVLPGEVRSIYRILDGGKTVEFAVTLQEMQANRLPDAYWFSFYPEDVVSVSVEKMGQMVDVCDVAPGGNRQMYGIDRFVEVTTPQGKWRITSDDALLVSVGERRLLNYSTQQPDVTRGVHFCLYNNAWGTNFSQWFEGSVCFRFKVEWIG